MAANTPEWYHPGDIRTTVLRAIDEADASTNRVVAVLRDHEVDAPNEQVRELVETTRDRVEAGLAGVGASPASESVVDAEAGELAVQAIERPVVQGRAVSFDDLNYLSSREAAIVLGAVLSRYEGKFRIPEAVDDLAVNLLWNRQQTTVGIRVVSRPQRPITDTTVERIDAGTVTPPAGRSPSKVGIAATVPFTEAAQEAASEADIELFGPDTLRTWLSEARLPRDEFGQLLESGELSADERSQVLDNVPTVPPTIRESDPLGVVGSPRTVTADMATDEGHDRDTGRSEEGESKSSPDPASPSVDERIPVDDRPAQPGTLGELYADPAEDGDFGALDRYVDDLSSDASESGEGVTEEDK